MENIGKIIDDGTTAQRDAIHVAIAPVVAWERLSPGQRIGFINDNCETVGEVDKPIGIVDPFLTLEVRQGQRFWMFLLPNTITSLRHDWTHPSFRDQALVQPDSGSLEESKAWVAQFASELGKTYKSLMNAAESYNCCGDYVMDNTESYKDADYNKWPMFWHHYSRITGQKVDDPEGTVFTCSC